MIAIPFFQNSKVTVGLHQNGKSVVITRYYTPDEIEAKQKALRAKGKSINYIPPYSAQQLDKVTVDKLLEVSDEIRHKINMVLVGEELSESESLIPLHRDVMLSLDCNNMIVHLR